MWLLALPESLSAVTRSEVTAQQPNFRGKASAAAPSPGYHGGAKHSQTSFVFFSFFFFFLLQTHYTNSLNPEILPTIMLASPNGWCRTPRKGLKTKSEWVFFPLGVPVSPILIKTTWKIYLAFFICFVLSIYLSIISSFIYLQFVCFTSFTACFDDLVCLSFLFYFESPVSQITNFLKYTSVQSTYCVVHEIRAVVPDRALPFGIAVVFCDVMCFTCFCPVVLKSFVSLFRWICSTFKVLPCF